MADSILLQPAVSPASHQKAEPSDAETIERAKAGDEEAFVRLYDQHKARVRSICRWMTNNSSEVEDLTQEVFMNVLSSLHSFRGGAAFSTWLSTVSKYTVLRHFRKNRIQATSLEATLETDEGEALERYVAQKDDPAVRLTLERAIRQLPPGARAVFILHDLAGYKHKEIAQMRGRTVGTCQSQLRRARTKLRNDELKGGNR